jgi:hypothetical protein
MSEADEETNSKETDNSREAKYGLSRAEDDRGRLQADLERALADKLMAQFDTGAAVVRDIETNAGLFMPTLEDIRLTLDRVQQEPPALADLARILESDGVGDLTIEGVHLNELLGRGGASVAQRKVLRTGFQFLHRKLYAEAAEWWTLNRSQDRFSPFYCVLTLLLAWTYQLQGNQIAARAAADEAAACRKFLK